MTTLNDRGQTTQLGLLLATVVIMTLLATVQVTVSPNVQSETEYNHAAAVLEDMEGVHADTLAAATTTSPRSTSVRMGSDYPNYVVLMQPPGPTGTLRTTDSHTIALENAKALHPETADYLDGSPITYTTTGLAYDPSYNQYQDAPTTVLRGTTVYEQYDADHEVIAASSVVTGRELQLITTTGDISTTQVRPLLVQSVPLSHSTSTVRVENDGSTPIKLRIQSNLPLENWREMLASELDADTSAGSPATDNDGRFIAELQEDTSTSPHTIVIVLETGVSYQLQTAKVGHKTAKQAAFPNAAVPAEHYLTTPDSTTQIATEEETIPLTVEVRDTFNNGVSGTVVEGTVRTQGSLAEPQRISTTDGTITFRYTAPEITQPTGSVSSQTHRVRFELTTRSGTEATVEFEIDVQNTHN